MQNSFHVWVQSASSIPPFLPHLLQLTYIYIAADASTQRDSYLTRSVHSCFLKLWSSCCTDINCTCRRQLLYSRQYVTFPEDFQFWFPCPISHFHIPIPIPSTHGKLRPLQKQHSHNHLLKNMMIQKNTWASSTQMWSQGSLCSGRMVLWTSIRVSRACKAFEMLLLAVEFAESPWLLILLHKLATVVMRRKP